METLEAAETGESDAQERKMGSADDGTVSGASLKHHHGGRNESRSQAL
jgi:hypothetical protein